VIAEIGINHGGELDTARRLIDSAAQTGCDAVKFQTYITEQRAPKGNQEIYDILKKCELPFADFDKLMHHSKGYGLEFFSTPFDKESVDYLESINVGLYKVASFDVVNKELLRRLSATGKPIVMSVGMANIKEIKAAYDVIGGYSNLSLLHCVSAYPTKEEDANLSAIKVLQELFPECVIGLSDHTPGVKVPLFAVAAGAQIIEKHYRIDDDMDCVDAPVSITENVMKKMIAKIRSVEKIMGEPVIEITDAQQDALIFRRPTI
jgi:sialic acid synthase SpsE